MATNSLSLKNVEFDQIDHSDYPDFSDAYICYAEHEDGTPLTEDELEAISSELTHELLWNHLY